MKRSFSHEEVSTVTTVDDRVLNKCFLQKETKVEVLSLKAYQVEGDSFSFLVTYLEKLAAISHANLDGHIIKFLLERPDPVRQLEHTIPKQFLESQETCLDHVMIVLSEMHLPSDIQQRIVHYISSEAVKFNRSGEGFRVEVKFEVSVDLFVRIECRCCCVREGDVARKETDVNCPICLTELSSATSRMELECSHVFHSECVMQWINYKNASCPICRARAIGQTVSLF